MKFFATLFAFLLPAITFAQQTTVQTEEGLFGAINSLIGIILPILYAVAILFIVFKLVTWILAKGEDKADKLKELGYSLLFLFVLFSITGIIALLQNTTDIGKDNSNITVPNLQLEGGRFGPAGQ